MANRDGFEPPLTILENVVLPLHYRKVGKTGGTRTHILPFCRRLPLRSGHSLYIGVNPGIEPCHSVSQTDMLPLHQKHHYMVLPPRVELGLRDYRSRVLTIELKKELLASHERVKLP